MGLLIRGILGGFAGKVGTVVGADYRGTATIRSLPAIKKSRQASPKQEEHQAKFSVGIKFASLCSDLVDQTYQSLDKGQSAMNMLFKAIVPECITGLYPNFEIDYSKVHLSKGTLKGAYGPAISSPAAGIVKFGWEDNSDGRKNLISDKAVLVVYCPELNDLMYTTEGGFRNDEEAEMEVRFFSGKQVHTWISFLSADGLKSSHSVYLGIVQVV